MAEVPKTGKILAQGKTKTIYEILNADGQPSQEMVLVVSRDDITAGDGVRHETMPEKGVFSTTTTCNCFTLLHLNGVEDTHFIGRIDDRSFLAFRVRMLPIEVVIRRRATGSYLKRHPEVAEGSIFKEPVVEFFLKDDARHDPLMVWNEELSVFELYQAKMPVSDESALSYTDAATLLQTSTDPTDWTDRMQEIAQCVFLILERAWQKQNVALIDLKIEFGVDAITGRLLVADVIDNDSWRIWPGGDKKKMLDKQVFRDAAEPATVMEQLRRNYQLVAEATTRFLAD